MRHAGYFPPMSNDLVLLTGATGFLATHTTVALLEAGYRVRGTARSVERAVAMSKNLPLNDEQRSRLSFVRTELLSDEGWKEAMEGCRFVLHLASPVPSQATKDADSVIRPAKEGAVRVLRAAAEAKVERVVMTSSTAAVLWGQPRDGSRIYDETNWTVLNDEVAAYEQSKTIAERAAWEFMKSAPGLELVTILPAAILGPLLDPDVSLSGDLVRVLLAREIPGIPDLGFSLVDVRDVAEIHVKALTTPGIAGQRFLLGSPHTPLHHIAEVLNARFGPDGFRVPMRSIPSWVLRVMSLWDRAAKLTAGELGKRQDLSIQRARETFGYQPRDLDQTIVAMGESMIRLGVVRLPSRA